MGTFDALEALLQGEFTVSQLAGVLDDIYSKSVVGKLPPVEAEQRWETLIQAYSKGVEVHELEARDVLAAINFDISLAPYLGVSPAKKKEFYLWCLKRARFV